MTLIKRIIAIVILVFCHNAFTQILEPAKWVVTINPLELTLNGETTLSIAVTLDDGWYIYSTDQDPDTGPMPTEIIFEPHESYKLIGKPKPVKLKQKFEEVWQDTVRIITESGGGFKQKIKILKKNPVIKGKIKYSVCSTESGMCIFPEEDFEISGSTLK